MSLSRLHHQGLRSVAVPRAGRFAPLFLVSTAVACGLMILAKASPEGFQALKTALAGERIDAVATGSIAPAPAALSTYGIDETTVRRRMRNGVSGYGIDE